MPDNHTLQATQGPRTCLALGHIEEPSPPRGAAPRPSRTPEHARLRLPQLVRRPDAPQRAASPTSSPNLHLVEPRPQDDELPPGTCLGRHVLVRLRSEGGTCRIYDAEHVQHGHRAVARVPRREVLRAHAWIAERMLANAALLADAPHPGVVAIYDYGWTDEVEPRPFMITERIVGADLAAALEERGPLPWRFVVELARELAGALHHFHGLGVVHGDLKPGNVMLVAAEASRPRIRIIDPDLARRFDAPPDPGLSPGTPSYLAPEHVYGLRPSVKSDLFSLGVIFYELLIGHCPIPGERRLRALQAGAPWPQLPALHLAYPDLGVPVALSRLISRLTSHDRGLRPRAASEVACELEGIGDRQLVVIAGPTPRRAVIASRSPAFVASVRCERIAGAPDDESHRTGPTEAPLERLTARFDDAWGPAPRGQPSLLAPRSPRTPWTVAIAALAIGLLGWALLGALHSAPGTGVRSLPMRDLSPPSSADHAAAPSKPVPVPQDRSEEPGDAPTEPSSDGGPAPLPEEPAALPLPTRARERRSTRPPPEVHARRSGAAPLPSVDEDPDEAANSDAEAEASILAFRTAIQIASRNAGAETRQPGSPDRVSPPASPDPVVVPGVTYRPIAEAERTLAAAGLSATPRAIVHARCEAQPVGTVIAQDPAPGTRFDADLPVILRVCQEWIAAEQ